MQAVAERRGAPGSSMPPERSRRAGGCRKGLAAAATGILSQTDGSGACRRAAGLTGLILNPAERKLAVLDLDPMRRSSGAIGPVAMHGDHALQPHQAGMPKQVRADLALFEVGQEDTVDARARRRERWSCGSWRHGRARLRTVVLPGSLGCGENSRRAVPGAACSSACRQVSSAIIARGVRQC